MTGTDDLPFTTVEWHPRLMADLKGSIASCCKQLRISANFAERAMPQEGETNQEYLYNLLSNEVAHRTERRKTKLLNVAGFPKMYQREQRLS